MRVTGNPRRHIPAVILFCIVAALSLCLAGGADGFVGKKMTIKNFVLPQLKPNGEKDWVLRAKEGVSSGNSFLLRTVFITIYRDIGDRVEVRTTECIFDRVKKSGSSDKRVNIRSEKMLIDGVGFDLDGTRKSIVIRSQVRVKFFKTDENLFGKTEK